MNSRNASLTRSGLQPLAEAVTELTSPTVYCPALLVAVAASDVPDYGFAALGWGALAGLFVGVLPLAFLKLGARRGRWDTHHVSDRDRRLVPFLFTIASVAVGLTLLAIGSAPRNLIALIIGMFAGLGVMLAVSRCGKSRCMQGQTLVARSYSQPSSGPSAPASASSWPPPPVGPVSPSATTPVRRS